MMYKKLLPMLLAFLLCCTLGASGQEAKDSLAETYIVNGERLLLTVGDEITLVAHVTPDTLPQQFAWSLKKGDEKKGVVTLDAQTGTVTANKPGSVTVIATSLADKTSKGTSVITVLEDPEEAPAAPVNMPVFESLGTVNLFKGDPLLNLIGGMQPGNGETWDQITYYYNVRIEAVQPSLNEKYVLYEDGTILAMGDMVQEDTLLTFQWTLTWKDIRGEEKGVLHGKTGKATQQVELHTAPTRIIVHQRELGEQSLGPGDDLIIGRVDNFVFFDVFGVAINAAVDCPDFSVRVDSAGQIILTMETPVQEKLSVQVTLSARDCQDETITSPPISWHKEPVIWISAESDVHRSTKGVYNLLAKDGTARLSVFGYEVERWKSSKKAFRIDSEGNASFSKAVSNVTVTAYLKNGQKVTGKVNVLEKEFAKDIVFQVKQKGNWVETNFIELDAGKSIPTRLYAPDGGKIILEEMAIGNDRIAARAAKLKAPVKAKKIASGKGEVTMLVMVANGQHYIVPLAVTAADDKESGMEEKIVPIDVVEELN